MLPQAMRELRSFACLIQSEKGVVLPVALMVLVILTSLTATFVMLGTSEPQISANLKLGAEALGVAEAGMEAAIWAFNNPVVSGLTGFPTTIPSRYNSSLPHDSSATLVAIGTGGYTLTLASGATSNERTVTASGWVPDNTAAPRAKRILTATLMSLNLRMDPPGALNVKGQLNVSGNSTIDGRNSACPPRVGSYTSEGTSISGSGDVYGADGNAVPDQPTDYSQNQPASSFDPLTLTQQELNLLKGLAKTNGTYYQGTVSLNPLPNGIVFVDTVSGNPIGDPPNASDLASVTVTGGTASGWLIVMGGITIDGNVSYTGLMYAANDFVYHGTGTGGITGAVISLNVLNTGPSTIDSSANGNSTIAYDCNAINTGVATGGTGSPTIPQGFFVKPGTWREIFE